ncbi:MAG: glycosyltransferase family 2 protein [Calditrichaeota bacterium]|nr:glycosyltransferase family 2 protein [Calditrichota bacterium]
MTNAVPEISVGLPVYNGEPFLRDALESILNQSYQNFEIIISDNNSSDQTPIIIKEYCDKDKRIRPFFSNENKGASWNYNKVFQESRGKYFCWLAHDDIIDKDYLSELRKVLESDPSIVLAFSRVIKIDDKGKELFEFREKLDVGSWKPSLRFQDLIQLNHSCLQIFGLMRSEVLKKTSLIGTYVASDRVLLAHLSLLGRFYEHYRILFCHREHNLRSTKKITSLHKRLIWFDTTKKNKISFPHWKLFGEYSKSIMTRSIGKREKVKSSWYLSIWFFAHLKYLFHDCIDVFFIIKDNTR